MFPEPPPGAGTGHVRFDEGPLIPPPATMSAHPVDQVLTPGPPASCATPLPVGPVVDSMADQLRALELLSSFMDPPEVEALRSWLVPPPVRVPSEPALTSHRALAQELADKCKRQEKLQTQLSEQRIKVVEDERVLERMQALLVGEASDLDEEILLELRRKVSVVPELEDMDASDGSTPRPVTRKRSQARATRVKKVKILSDSSTKILVTCKRSWVSTGGSRRDFFVGCPLAAAALLSCSVSSCRWLQPHFAVSATFDCDRWSSQVTQPVRCTPLWPASWLLALDKSRGSKVQIVWEVYDDRLRFMSRSACDDLTRSLLDGDISSAWAVWSSAAETALADAYCFSGGPVPDRVVLPDTSSRNASLI